MKQKEKQLYSEISLQALPKNACESLDYKYIIIQMNEAFMCYHRSISWEYAMVCIC